MDIGPELPPHLKKKAIENIETNNEMIEDYIGPALPPHLRKNTENKAIDTAVNDVQENIGPSLPPHLIKTQNIEPVFDQIGPALPPHLTAKAHGDENGGKDGGNVEENDGTFGPPLPPAMKKESKILGPQLPPGLMGRAEEESDEDVVGPLLPPDLSEEDQQFLIARDFEKRAERMKDKLSGKLDNKKVEREEWMTELPPVFQGFGMGPRQFRAQPKEIGDRSGWTDTPADKKRKAEEGNIIKVEEIDPNLQRIRDRDHHISKQIKQNEEKESLLAMHEKSRKRKLKEDKASGKADVRRPFDRDIDLQANRFDEAAKKRMLKKGAGLSSRFSHGETSATFL